MKYSENNASLFLQDYIQRVASSVVKTQYDTLAEIVGAILKTKNNGQRIFTAGNGGSAATASHICNDLLKGARVMGREGFRAFCLNDSSPVVTCLANDFSYKDIYSIQLKTFANPGDLFIVFSGSGNSPNILESLQTAREIGMNTIGFGGRDGGKMRDLCDHILIAPTYSMEELEDMHMIYVHAIVSLLKEVLPDHFDVETIRYRAKGKPIKFAFFDYDGTVAALRCGWQETVTRCACATLTSIPGVTQDEVEPIVRAYIEKETGRPMIALGEHLHQEVLKRGGQPLQPIEYKLQYDVELDKLVTEKYNALESGQMGIEDILTPGFLGFIHLLKENGVSLCLASGTDERRLKSECERLGISKFFDLGIFGAREDGSPCEKHDVLNQILTKNNWTGDDLVGFGDGGFDMQAVKAVGGYAVGLATNEDTRTGVNEKKREFLLEAGADIIVPDFSNPKQLWDSLNR